jgi:type I restriction-modification system DNA methylase subunit
MALSLDKPKLDNLADEIWKSAERLRGKFKAYEYQNVILPIVTLVAKLRFTQKQTADYGSNPVLFGTKR